MKLGKLCSIAAVALIVLGAPTVLFAAPCSNPTPVAHVLGGNFFNCPDANPLNAFSYTLGATGTNTNGVDFACRSASGLTGQGLGCAPQAVADGDGLVTLYWDYANSGSTQCPNSSQVLGAGRQVVQLVSNNGSSLILCVGYEPNTQTYPLEGAMPDDGNFGGLPIACNFDSAPELVSVTPITPTTETVCVRLRAPKVFSDCDATSNNKISNAGFVDTCDPIAEPNAPTTCAGTAGRLFVRTAPCGTSPDPRISAGWALQSTVPGPAGSVCYTATRPPSGCGFVGATAMFGGTESLAMVGSWQLAQAAASGPKASIDKAALAKGTVSIDFHTTTEVGAIGFNVLANGSVLNSGLIAAGTDGGGHTYNFTARQDVLKSVGAKVKKSKGDSVEIVIQTMTSGGPINSDPVKLQRSK